MENKVKEIKCEISNGFSFPSWPHYDQDEINAVVSVLNSGKVNYWTGSENRLFESEFAEFIGTEYSVSVANGTLALEAALAACGVDNGSEVIVTSRTYVASASCIVMSGGRPVIVDVDPSSQNITIEAIKSAVTPKTKAIIAVHLGGWPCDMDPIMEFAREHGLKVIEDCAQATGAKYKGRRVGSIGDIAAFSFCQDKIMTTGGEGGMVTTNNRDMWSKVWSLKDHGKDHDLANNENLPLGFKWLHTSFGSNWRMTEMQAAIGRVQLKKLPSWLEIRRRNAEILHKCFADMSALRVIVPPDYVEHAYYRYYTFIRPELLKRGWSRDLIMSAIEERGIPCQVGSCSEIYREAAFAGMGWGLDSRLPVAKELGETSLAFLVHSTLTQDDMEKTCDIVKNVLNSAIC